MEKLQNCTVTMMVSNLKDAINFYTNTLGLALHRKYGDHYAEIGAAGLLIGLHPTSKRINPGDNLSIGFGVKDFDSTMASLAAKGIIFQVEQEGPIRLAHFTDPDKNPLYLAEIKDERG